MQPQPTFWQTVVERLLDFAVTFLGFLFSGGLLLLIFEIRRHRRERQQWEREDAKLEIDVPTAELDSGVWIVTDRMDDKQKLRLYENQLIGKVSNYQFVVDFVIRNTTNGELVVVAYGVEEDAPPGPKTYRLYDMKTADGISSTDMSGITLPPLGTISRTAYVSRSLDESQKMDAPPSRVRVYARTSDGVLVQKEAKLQRGGRFAIGYTPGGEEHLQRYLERMSEGQIAKLDTTAEPPPGFVEESDIPF
jgi:hypothetical protein